VPAHHGKQLFETETLGDVLVIAHTGRDFADAVVGALKQWRFSPSRIAGEPVGSTITLTVKFQVTGVLAYVKPPTAPRLEDVFAERFVHQPFSIADLDRMPVALARSGPIYPKEWIVADRTGTVAVEFFIDENGRVRFPPRQPRLRRVSRRCRRGGGERVAV
jgi:outer membrane biosynthesis protein TonB